jgi:hypothetical protein
MPDEAIAADSWERMLNTRVIRNRAILSVERRPDGALDVRIPLKSRWWNRPTFKWVFPFREERTVRLDSLGAVVFGMVESEPLVEEVVDRIAVRENLSFHESRLAVSQYIRRLAVEGLVVLQIERL